MMDFIIGNFRKSKHPSIVFMITVIDFYNKNTSKK